MNSLYKALLGPIIRSVAVAALNVAVGRVLQNIDKTSKLSADEKTSARGALLQLVQELGAELGTKL